MTDYSPVIQKGPATVAEERRERAVLVGVDRPGLEWPLDSSLAELERLADTAGADTVAVTTQKLDAPNPRTFVGSGKAEEIADLARAHEADLVIFDDELTPSQQANLEKVMDKSVKVIDRTALILDIFALHATSKEGRLQVRLAQNQYLYPRLRGMWAHLASNRMGGGVGSRFGEGESQLEVDRRMVRKRITTIRRELAHLADVRSLQRESRYGSGMFKVALAGYTNAGKSSLLNRLTGSDVLSYDKLFATLDSTTRKFELPEGREVTATDTVGFIQKLPTTLVEAFKSTLDEITGADLILHVIDASSPEFESQADAVHDVLDQIGAHSIATLDVFNKCDLLDEDMLAGLRRRYPHALFVSARTGQGTEALIDALSQAASASDEKLTVLVPYQRGDLVSLAHERCHLISEEHRADGTLMQMLAAPAFASAFAPFVVEDEA
ncbi:MAG: GTPase HflX [Adlercreutzia sp.]|nr:GTPase HflX [Adlercreutzia sp.]